MATLESHSWEPQDTKTNVFGRFQFSLRSLFVAITVCAVLAAAWPWRWSSEGQALLFVCLGLSAIQCGLVTWAIAAWRQQRAIVATISNDERRVFVGTLTLGVAIPVVMMLAILGMVAGGRSFQPPLAICTGLLIAEL